MKNQLKDRTIVISGGTRGIGKAIGLRAARDGANIVIAAKTEVPHPRLPGTIYTAAEEIEAAGGTALPCVVDIREEKQVQAAVDQAVAKFGGIDILINNASAIYLAGTVETPMKRFDLMNQVNVRGTYLCSQICIPHLKASSNPHILNLSPPLNMDKRWFAPHVAYTSAKFGMSLCILGWAGEFKGKIAANAIWPRTAVATAAISNILVNEEALNQCRKPVILADTAYRVLTKPAADFTGNFLIDDTFLVSEGVTDLDQYSYEAGIELLPDFFVPEEPPAPEGVKIMDIQLGH